MENLIFVQVGTGIDIHGQNITKASVRAVEDATLFNSMPGIERYLPEQNLDNLKVNVRLAVPVDRDKVDEEQIRKAIPYGDVTVEVTEGGMASSSGIILEEKDDRTDLMYIVNAAVEVGY